MSQENVERVRLMYEAFAKGDIPTVLGFMDAEVEWREADHFIYADGNPYIGPDAVLEGVFMRLGSEWESFSVAADELLDAGETVVARGHYSGTYKENGRQVRSEFAHFFTFRDGKLVKFKQYTDTALFAETVKS